MFVGSAVATLIVWFVATDHQHAVALGDAARQGAGNAEVEGEFVEVDEL